MNVTDISEDKVTRAQQHIIMHQHLDVLCALYMQETGRLLSNSTIMDLAQWSQKKTVQLASAANDETKP